MPQTKNDAPAGTQPAVVVMGVSAAGKTTVATRLARELGCRFVDADDLHPAVNLAKMAAGTPLTDDDRWPWLDLVGEALDAGAAQGGLVIACSALRRAYRDRIRALAPGALFVHLTGSEELLAERAAGRVGHFMPPSLLASQLALLEPIGLDERGLTIDVAAPADAIVAEAADWVRTQG